MDVTRAFRNPDSSVSHEQIQGAISQRVLPMITSCERVLQHGAKYNSYTKSIGHEPLVVEIFVRHRARWTGVTGSLRTGYVAESR